MNLSSFQDTVLLEIFVTFLGLIVYLLFFLSFKEVLVHVTKRYCSLTHITDSFRHILTFKNILSFYIGVFLYFLKLGFHYGLT